MKIEEIIVQSTESLNGDPALRSEIEAELGSHLRSTVSALESDGRTPEEAERIAVECFGDPEAIDERLLEVNFSRLKFRARMRLALKILALPLLLLALFFAIDVRTLASTFAMNPDAPSWVHSLLDTSPRGNDDFHLLEGRPESEEARKLYEENIHNPIYRTTWLSELFELRKWKEDAAKREELTTELKRARELEPGNALFTYLLAAMELEDAVEFESRPKKDQPRAIVVKERASFERGMAEVRRGLEQLYFNTYTREATRERLGTPLARKDYPNALRDTAVVAGTRLPWATPCSQQGELLAFYGKNLAEEGKLPEADSFLNGYKKWALQMNGNSLFLIDQLIIYRVIRRERLTLADTYRQLNRPDLAGKAEEQLEEAYSIYDEYFGSGRAREIENDDLAVQNYGGIFGRMFTGALGNTTREDLLPELKLSYNTLDQFLLAGLECILAALGIILALLWLVFHGKGSFLVLLPGKEYWKLILWGIILPVGAYFLLTRIDFLSGRGYSFQKNGILIGVQTAWFLLLMPLWAMLLGWFRLKRHFTKGGQPKPKSNLLFGNVLLLMVFFLLGTAAISRTILSVEQRYYFAKENFVFPSYQEDEVGFSVQESRLVNQWRERNRVIFAELLQEPLLLQVPEKK